MVYDLLVFSIPTTVFNIYLLFNTAWYFYILHAFMKDRELTGLLILSS